MRSGETQLFHIPLTSSQHPETANDTTGNIKSVADNYKEQFQKKIAPLISKGTT